VSRAKDAPRPTGPAYHTQRETRPFDVTLTDEERAALAARFAQADDELEAALEAARERKRAERETLDALRGAKREIRAAMRSGIERRQVICEWQIRDGGERVLVRTDTGEIVETQAQRVLA
jgi:hypothetical protein